MKAKVVGVATLLGLVCIWQFADLGTFRFPFSDSVVRKLSGAKANTGDESNAESSAEKSPLSDSSADGGKNSKDDENGKVTKKNDEPTREVGSVDGDKNAKDAEHATGSKKRDEPTTEGGSAHGGKKEKDDENGKETKKTDEPTRKGGNGGKKEKEGNVSVDTDKATDVESAKGEDADESLAGATYDEDGWHLLPPDWVSHVIEPHHLQPFYLMPVFFGVKTMMTMVIFGVGVLFKKKTPGCFDVFLSWTAKPAASWIFIAMALNGYRSDHKDYSRYLSQSSSNFDAFLLLSVTWVTSANYIAARAVWCGLMIENPVLLLKLKPKYTAIPFLGIPLVPGFANWITPLKHIYALVLLPYYVPYYIWSVLTSIMVCCLACSHQCACFFGYLKAICCCTWLGYGVIFTLGLYGPWRESLGYWWGFLKPMYYMTMIQMWVQFIAPAVITCVYGLVVWIQSWGKFDLVSQTAKGLAMAFASQQAAGQPGAAEEGAATTGVGGLVIERSDAQKLIMLNAPHWKEDFDYTGTDYSLLESTVDKEAAADEAQVDLEDAKIAIFAATLMKLASIVVEQIGIIFSIRACKATSYEGFVSSIYLTLSERTANNYFHYISTVGELAHQTALDVVWMLL